MYGFSNKGLNLDSIVGQPLNQLCQGAYDLNLVFNGSDLESFLVMGEVKVLKAGIVIATWGDGGWDSLDFQELLNAVPVSWRVVDERTLEIAFEDHLAMQVIDDSEQYEAAVIRFNDPTLPIIVV